MPPSTSLVPLMPLLLLLPALLLAGTAATTEAAAAATRTASGREQSSQSTTTRRTTTTTRGTGATMTSTTRHDRELEAWLKTCLEDSWCTHYLAATRRRVASPSSSTSASDDQGQQQQEQQRPGIINVNRDKATIAFLTYIQEMAQRDGIHVDDNNIDNDDSAKDASAGSSINAAKTIDQLRRTLWLHNLLRPVTLLGECGGIGEHRRLIGDSNRSGSGSANDNGATPTTQCTCPFAHGCPPHEMFTDETTIIGIGTTSSERYTAELVLFVFATLLTLLMLARTIWESYELDRLINVKIEARLKQH